MTKIIKLYKFSNILKKEMKRQNLTTQQVAEQIGFTHNSVLNWVEKGKNPRLSNMILISSKLGFKFRIHSTSRRFAHSYDVKV